MQPTVDIVVIGHLSRNPYWGEDEVRRPPVATCSLVRSGDATILVDPSLPGDLMKLRLFERSGLTPDQIDQVFLTSLHPTHRLGIEVFDDAVWLVHAPERDAVCRHLQAMLESEEAVNNEWIESELALIGRMDEAPGVLADRVHLFPCPGITPGGCGLLVTALQTTVIAGDAVLTRDHFEHGAVSENAADADAAKQSLADILEIADFVVPGHDNIFPATSDLMPGF